MGRQMEQGWTHDTLPVLTDAVYKPKNLAEFSFNPMIEALPDPAGRSETVNALMVRPPYRESDRLAAYETRLDYTQRIINSHMPTVRDIDISMRIGKCIRWGYVNRNPVGAPYSAFLGRGGDGSRNYFGGYQPNTQGFAIIGVSGIGKSTTVEAILRMYPQVIRHTNYKGMPLQMTQVVWMKLECPGDGSLKSLCLGFFQELDRLVGTSYFAQYSRSRCTLDRMELIMKQLCVSYNVGLIVIDEIQGLKAARGTSEAALNFFISFANTISVPVIMIGTPKALSILQNEFQQAKRGSGQGDVLWSRMENDASWDTYVDSIWTYQYTSDTVPLSREIRDAIYYEAQGIPFIASHLYKLVQEDAILSGKESFGAEDFNRVAAKKMGLTAPLRDAIRKNEDIDLNALDTAAKIRQKPAKPAGTHVKKDSCKRSVLEESVMMLAKFGITRAEAEENVLLAMDELGSSAPTSLVGFHAMELLFDQRKNEAAACTPVTGYESLKKEGMIAAEVL